MAKTLIGVVYDAHTLAVRRIFIPDDDKQLRDGSHRLAPGEVLITSPRWKGASLDVVFEAVRTATGRVPPNLSDVHQKDDLIRSMGGRQTIRIP